jgi:hypothetical protein
VMGSDVWGGMGGQDGWDDGWVVYLSVLVVYVCYGCLLALVCWRFLNTRAVLYGML